MNNILITEIKPTGSVQAWKVPFEEGLRELTAKGGKHLVSIMPLLPPYVGLRIHTPTLDKGLEYQIEFRNVED